MFSTLRRLLAAVPPEINLIPLLQGIITSEIFFSPEITSEIVKPGLTPKRTCEFAIPRSVSNRKISEVIFLRAIDRFTAIVVLPTPPLPLVIAIESDIYKILFHILSKRIFISLN